MRDSFLYISASRAVSGERLLGSYRTAAKLTDCPDLRDVGIRRNALLRSLGIRVVQISLHATQHDLLQGSG